MAGIDYTLPGAWHAWLDSTLSPSDTLAGVAIYWWGRVGECMGFLAALILLLDGAAQTASYRRFGAWVGRLDRLVRDFRRDLLFSMRELTDILRGYNGPPRTPPTPHWTAENDMSREEYRLLYWYCGIIFAPLVPGFILLLRYEAQHGGRTFAFWPWFEYWYMWTTTWPLQIIVRTVIDLPLVIVLPIVASHFCIFRMLVACSSLQGLSLGVRVTAMILLVLGLHFTLIAI